MRIANLGVARARPVGIVLLLILAAIFPTWSNAGLTKMYWTAAGPDLIWHANLNGSAAGFDSIEDAYQVAVDSENGRIYWTDFDGLLSANEADGSDVRLLYIADAGPIRGGVSLDPSKGKIYFSDPCGQGCGKILRVDLDGFSNIETIMEVPRVTALTVAPGLDDTICWVHESVNPPQPGIYCDSPEFGTQLITTGSPTGIDIHPEEGKIYWTDSPSSDVRRANLDGSQQEILTFSPSPQGLAIDVPTNALFWVDQASGGTVRRLDLTTMQETVVVNVPIDAVSHGGMDIPVSGPFPGACCLGGPSSSQCVVNTEAECLSNPDFVSWTLGGDCSDGGATCDVVSVPSASPQGAAILVVLLLGLATIVLETRRRTSWKKRSSAP